MEVDRERWMLRSEGRKLRCLVGFCLLGLILLILPILYLLNQSARKTSEGETWTEKMPEMQRQQADAPNCNSCTADSQPDHDCIPNVFPILHWRNDPQDDNGRIIYKDGYLTVLETGHYFVYAQVTFHCPEGKCKDMTYCQKNVSEETYITQIISKQSASYGSTPIKKLIASDTIGSKDKWKKSLYLGGVIQLRRHDTLMVNISNPTLVDARRPEITFFGAFFI
ncbi:tumor necrosis factor ligand superfamily member 15 [Sceloporus undulatus]|uniref:tumor necrosis factor ligand superfamily member 15 n=1 Tax=Sceloporus undulatus TaxID=8520 RepID=UPI001C4AA57D|nr:tumor necrosis factor ligand superfamily member 15 [Sceloporus undulatus]